MQPDSQRAVLAALLANVGIAIAKLAAFAFTGAAALLAESAHSIADSGNEALLALGSRRAQKAPTVDHPFGYARERYFWAFVVALVLFSIGSVFAIYEGVSKLINVHVLDQPGVAFAVLGVSIVLESLSMRTAVRAARQGRGDRSWWQYIRTAKTPELPVVLLEDFGALVGLALAAVGIGLNVITGDARYDAAAGVAIGVLLGVIAAVLAIEMKSLLIGEAASPEDVAAIRSAIINGTEVDRIIHLRTEHLGPDDLLVAAKVDLSPAGEHDTPRAIDRVEARMRARVPHARVIYLEPDEYRADHGDY
ncbi:MAG TPA: cation diffusion facilitator family transporter [Acidimicrobiia bacterium]|nr:cation diffusion facilitator family transporter [Acidimicrobiia bacterium]